MNAIYPVPVISRAACDFIETIASQEVVFREDSFDPVTRIRRGRLYKGGRGAHRWEQVRIDNSQVFNWGTMHPDASYDPWEPDVGPEAVRGRIIEIGEGNFTTKWRIVDVERISIGHILLTLRSHSLFGLVPELLATLADMSGETVDGKKVQVALDALVDTFHRQLPTSTVDAARETARVVLAAWMGAAAGARDLGDVIPKIPGQLHLVRKAAYIINRLHPRGKSAEQERQANSGNALRPIAYEDAGTSVQLIGLILREIGWSA